MSNSRNDNYDSDDDLLVVKKTHGANRDKLMQDAAAELSQLGSNNVMANKRFRFQTSFIDATHCAAKKIQKQETEEQSYAKRCAFEQYDIANRLEDQDDAFVEQCYRERASAFQAGAASRRGRQMSGAEFNSAALPEPNPVKFRPKTDVTVGDSVGNSYTSTRFQAPAAPVSAPMPPPPVSAPMPPPPVSAPMPPPLFPVKRTEAPMTSIVLKDGWDVSNANAAMYRDQTFNAQQRRFAHDDSPRGFGALKSAVTSWQKKFDGAETKPKKKFTWNQLHEAKRLLAASEKRRASAAQAAL
jgi:ssDNA-binding Zn-finger/Zn-ribbon topoisomerase 1